MKDWSRVCMDGEEKKRASKRKIGDEGVGDKKRIG